MYCSVDRDVVGRSEQEAMVEQTQYLLGALDILSETDIFVGSYRCDICTYMKCNNLHYTYVCILLGRVRYPR